MRVRLTRQARGDLSAIFDYLAVGSGAIAENVMRRIEERYLGLSLFPEQGVARSDIKQGIRMLVVERWCLFYRVNADAVVILRIIDSARDVSRLTIPNDDT